MKNFTPNFKNWRWSGVKAFILGFALLLTTYQEGLAQTSFTQSNLNLNGGSVDLGTYLQFGPDGRLYVVELYGKIRIYSITKDGANAYRVLNEEIITDIINIPNHNDDGGAASRNERETTALVVGGTAANPVIYVSSSDPWTGGPGGDIDIDTNSGIITRFSWNGSSWDVVDLVRGLPRSEENHASHGMELVTVGGTRYIILSQGGHTNAGAPSQNFAWTTEYALSGAILAIDLDAVEGMSTKTDASSGRSYKYDLPTLDDPTRPNANGITDPNQAGYNGIDVGDPFGGNDGLNQAKLVPGGPVQIFSPGYRNSYDLVVTESGAVLVTDNGANGGWGGYPENEGLGGNATNNYRVGEPGSSSADKGENPVNNEDHLTLITNNINTYTFGSFYGGHPNPVRSNPSGAGLFTRGSHSSDPGDSNGNSYTDDWFRTSILGVNHPNFSTQSLPVDWPPVPLSEANPVEGDSRLPGESNPDGPSDVLLTTLLNNSNGIDEYTASGDMKGNLIIGRNNGSLHRIVIDGSGNLASIEHGWVTGLGSDANALGISCNGDNDPFPGTIWIATFNDKIVVLEPDGGNNPCILPGEAGYDPQADNDNDGYTNEDEDLNGTDLCSANSKPEDFDNDKLSDLIDLDDDNDSINDEQDPFQLGTPFAIPVNNELFNNQGSLKGYKGLGLTGLMNNGDPNPNYLNWLDDPDASNTDNDDILGGAVGAVTIYQTSGDALTNNQEKAFQYGVNVNTNTGNFTVSSRMLLPFQNFASGESQGIYIGTGFQDNYLKIILTAGGLEVHGEQNDIALTGLPTAGIGLPTSNLDLFFTIDPATGSVQAAYSLDGGNNIITVGDPYTATGALLNALQDANTPLAVGIIGTSGSNPEFAATWDFLNVNKIDDVEDGEVVFRVNAGDETITAIDGGLDWVSDIDASLSTNGFEVNTGNNTAYGPSSGWDPTISAGIQGTTPIEIFDWERWDEEDDEPEVNMKYTFNVGDPGDYKVRLFFRDTYSGTAQPGQRVFSITIDGVSHPELTDIDISANPGPNLATFIEVAANTTDNFLEIEFFRNVQSPFISGIEIIKGGSTGVPIVVQSVPNQSNQEGENTNVTVVASGGDGDLSFSASGLPPGVSIDPTNGLIGGTIDPGAATGSPYTVTVTVDDEDEFNSDAKLLSFTWTVTVNGGIPDAWTNITNVNEHIPRHENSMVQVGDKFYLFGGREDPQIVEVYDYNTNTWSTAASAPEQFNHFQAVVLEGMIWVICSFEDNVYPVEQPEEFIWLFDPANNEWIQGRSIPADRRRGSTGVIVYNNKFYIAGGNTIGHHGGYVAWFDEYDPATNTWTPLDDAPRARDHFHATVANDKLYLAGGRQTGGTGGVFEPRIGEVDVYDFATKSWTTLNTSSNLPTPRGGTTTVTFKDEVVVIGGEGNGQAFNNAEALDPTSGSWRTLAPMNHPRHGTQAIVSGDGIHITSGSPNQGGGSQNNMEVYGIDNPIGTALLASTLNVPASASIAASATQSITISNTGGNTGIFITSITLGGDNAADFQIVGGNPGPFLIPAGASHSIQVTNNGSGNENTATMTVNYGAGSTKTVTINPLSTNPGQIVFRVNAGGETLAALDSGPDWITDDGATLVTTGFEVVGGESAYGPPTSWDVTVDPTVQSNTPFDLFERERFDTEGEPVMIYTFNVVNPGTYKVRIFLREGWTGAATPGIRVFSVTVDGNSFPELTDIDLALDPGFQKATMVEVEVTTPDNLIEVEFIHNLQNPLVCGFEILSNSGPSETSIVLESITEQTNEEGETVSLNVVASGGDGALNYAAINLPPGLGIYPVSGEITGTIDAGAAANSPYSVQITVDDADANNADAKTTSFIWNVNAPNNNTAPVASFTATPTSGDAPLVVSFDASASIDPNGDALTYTWDFGDGTIGNGISTSHTFQNQGSYTATLTVSDGLLISQVSVLITVEESGCQAVEVNASDFESGWGIWNDGGTDARRNVSDAIFANSGIYCVRLRDNTHTSRITTDALDMSSFEEISVDLSFIAISMDNPTEDLWLQISTDGGASFNLVKAWKKETHFENNVRVTDQVIIPGPFTANTKLRFQLDASSDNDKVYLDDIVISGCSNAGSQNQAPTAQFTASPLIGQAPLAVDFNASLSSDPDGDPLTYSWDFGDGNVATGLTFSHTYQSTGTFTVILTVSDGQASTQAVGTIFVSGDNDAPIASFTATPTSGEAPLPVNFDASNSSDPENDPLTYSWDFGDGFTGTGINPSHTYSAGGVFTVTLTVNDGSASAESTTNITVTAPNQGPTASFTATPTSGEAPLFVSFDANSSSDPENDPLTYNWTFGDGETGTGPTTSHTYAGIGTYTVTLTVSDGEFSDQTSTTISVSVPNLGPTASFTANPTDGEVPLFVNFDASNSSDPENEPLTYSWDFGDGESATGVTTSHTFNSEGVFTVTLTVSDGSASDITTARITVNIGDCGIVEIDSEDFEGGWGIWNDGGTDARRNYVDAIHANSGIYTIRLRDNSTSSKMTTNKLDLSSFEEITIDFSFVAVSMDNVTEGFLLQLSTNGGASFTEIEEWRQSIDFDNNVRSFGQVTIAGPFSSNTQIRILCDGSNNYDWVYIDDVVITGCTNNPPSGLVVSNESSLNLAPIAVSREIEKKLLTETSGSLDKVIVFPNPTSEELNIKFLPTDASLQLFDINGKVLIDLPYTEKLDLSNFSKGIYILSVKTETAVRRIKVIKD